MSRELIRQKTEQATAAMRKLGIDCWLTFVRETKMMQDPVMPLLAGMGVVGASAFILTADGRKIAVLASFDADAFREQGIYGEILTYSTTSVREPLRETLLEIAPGKIAINCSVDDCAADGLTVGMYRMLMEILEGTGLEDRLVSAEPLVSIVRGVKSPEECTLIRRAAEETIDIFEAFERRFREGGTDWTTDAVEKFFQDEVARRGLDFSWDRSSDPSLTSGPAHEPGHGTPHGVAIEPGHALRVDFGIIKDGYSSDLQRTWYIPREGEAAAPDEVQRPFDVVLEGIRAAKSFLRPGVAGWEVDAVAREIVTRNGFAEYTHSLGHQIGTLAHDGGGGLSPRWERNGRKPFEIVMEGQAYTLEFGLPTPRGWVSLEEMVFVTKDGCEYVVPPQEKIFTLGE